MAKKRATKKPRMDVPLDPDDPYFGRSFNTKTGKFSEAVTAKSMAEAARAEEYRKLISTNTFVKGGKMQGGVLKGVKNVAPGVKGAREVFIKGKEVDVPLRNSQGQKYGSVKQIVPIKDPFGGVQRVVKNTQPLQGRTVEAGTRSMLEGLRSWMRGGGGFRIGGR